MNNVAAATPPFHIVTVSADRSNATCTPETDAVFSVRTHTENTPADPCGEKTIDASPVSVPAAFARSTRTVLVAGIPIPPLNTVGDTVPGLACQPSRPSKGPWGMDCPLSVYISDHLPV